MAASGRSSAHRDAGDVAGHDGGFGCAAAGHDSLSAANAQTKGTRRCIDMRAAILRLAAAASMRRANIDTSIAPLIRRPIVPSIR
jgi:hypothetical protein